MEPFRRQLATGQTSVMDWDIILYICFRLNSFFVCVGRACGCCAQKKWQNGDKEECLVHGAEGSRQGHRPKKMDGMEIDRSLEEEEEEKKHSILVLPSSA